MLTRPREFARGDDGVSLAETMVAMALTTVVGAMALSFFVWSGRATGNAAESSRVTDGVRVGVSAMAATLRVADSPTSQPGSTLYRLVEPLSRTSLAFFANDNANRPGSAIRTLPSRVVWSLTGSTVTEQRYAPIPGRAAQASSWASNYPTTPTTTRTLLRGVASWRLDYATVSSTGVLTTLSDTAVAAAGAGAAVEAVTVTVTTVATAGRPAQTVTATAVLTGSTS